MISKTGISEANVVGPVVQAIQNDCLARMFFLRRNRAEYQGLRNAGILYIGAPSKPELTGWYSQTTLLTESAPEFSKLSRIATRQIRPIPRASPGPSSEVNSGARVQGTSRRKTEPRIFASRFAWRKTAATPHSVTVLRPERRHKRPSPVFPKCFEDTELRNEAGKPVGGERSELRVYRSVTERDAPKGQGAEQQSSAAISPFDKQNPRDREGGMTPHCFRGTRILPQKPRAETTSSGCARWLHSA